MNVLLVPAHPGFPGQIPQSRKTVVCVCVQENQTGISTDNCLNVRIKSARSDHHGHHPPSHKLKDYSVWNILQEKVYKTFTTDLDDPKHRVRTEWAKLDHAVVAAAVRQWH